MSTSPKKLGLWTACLAQLIVVLDVSVVNVALPSIQRDLGLSAAAVSWVAMAYSLGFAGLLLVGARLADFVGTARLLTWSVGLFTVASVVGGVATEGWVLIVARAAQGISAAAVSPATFTLLTTTHAEGSERTRAITVWTAVSLVGGGLGNVASGVLTDLLSWRATLLINLPIGTAVVLAALVLHRRTTEGSGVNQGVDLAGAVLATAAFTSAAYALSSAGQNWSDDALWAAAASAALFVALFAQQRRSRHRLVPAAFTRDRVIILGNLAMALTAGCFQVAVWYFMTYRMQGRFGYSPIQAGLAFLPLTVSMLIVNLWLTPRLMRRRTPRLLILVGAATAVPGLVWLAIVTSGSFAFAVLVPTVAIGVGGGLMNAPLAALVAAGVRAQYAGAASGLMNTAKQFGGVLGLAVGLTAVGVVGSDRVAFVVMTAALVGVVGVMVMIPDDRFPDQRVTR